MKTEWQKIGGAAETIRSLIKKGDSVQVRINSEYQWFQSYVVTGNADTTRATTAILDDRKNVSIVRNNVRITFEVTGPTK